MTTPSQEAAISAMGAFTQANEGAASTLMMITQKLMGFQNKGLAKQNALAKEIGTNSVEEGFASGIGLTATVISVLGMGIGGIYGAEFKGSVMQTLGQGMQAGVQFSNAHFAVKGGDLQDQLTVGEGILNLENGTQEEATKASEGSMRDEQAIAANISREISSQKTADTIQPSE